MAKLLFVVHRYYPYPGGSENYVRWMAEEALSRGHEVSVYATDNQGDQNGVKVYSVFPHKEPFDLIIVHGADVFAQNHTLMQADKLQAPVLYMIILPSHSGESRMGMQNSKYIAWSTKEDWDHIENYNFLGKAVNVRHGIKYDDNWPKVDREQFLGKYGIDPNSKIFLSCGGYWPNKRMKELADLFEAKSGGTGGNVSLVTTGYGGYYDLMPQKTNRVFPLIVEEYEEVQKFMQIADLYIMHSDREGFGLVLLEASMKGVPWIAKHQAGAAKLVNALGPDKPLGNTYHTDKELQFFMNAFVENFKGFHCMRPDPNIQEQINRAHLYVQENHLIQHTVDDIEAVLRKELNDKASA